MRSATSIVVALAVIAGCSKDDGPPGTPTAATATNPRDVVFDAWTAGGLAVSPFEAAKTQVGQDCRRGKVASLDVLVCTYSSSDAAKTAEVAAYRWVGDTTGAAQVRGSLLIAVADRVNSDPNGKTINQLMKLAPK